MRITALLASVVHVPVAGLHSSAAWTAPAALLNPEALVPPVTSTSPVGKIVAFICRRADAIEPVYLHVGFASLRSMTSAVFVRGAVAPPGEQDFAGPVNDTRPQAPPPARVTARP